MIDAELTIKYKEFAARWKPTEEELASDLAEKISAADAIHLRRCAVIIELASLPPLVAAYLAVKMALDERAYGRLGQYLKRGIFPDDPDAPPIDTMAALRVMIAPVA